MRSVVLAWFGAFLLFFSFAQGSVENLDGTATMHAARALLLRGDSGLRRTDQGGQWLGERLLADHITNEHRAGRAFYGKPGLNDLVYVWFPMGHVWSMVPAVAAGEALHRAFPSVEATYRHRVAPGVADGALAANLSYRDGHFVFAQAIVATLPAVFGATSVLLLFFLARAFGARPVDAACSTFAIAAGTQFFPLTRECLSDGPGLCLLLAALLVTVRAHFGPVSARTMLAGGFAAGSAVLVRYPHAALVPLLVLAVALSARRHRRWSQLWWFLLGGLPCLLLLFAIDHARFGDVTDTGYPQASTWFRYPVWFGATKILFAAGKGILWFSPLLWLAVPLALRRRRDLRLGWLGWSLFAMPMLVFSSTSGWQSGQCWGVRYVTPGIVGLLAVVLPQLRPWRSHRAVFVLLVLAGGFVNVTSVIAPTRGYCQLAGQAVAAMYEREFRAGEIGAEDWFNLDVADHYFFLPRFSPLHAHWTYARRSWRGDFETSQGLPAHGSENTIEPLFGIVAVEPAQGTAPLHWEDRGGRHLWWVFWGELLGVRPALLVLPVLAAGAVLFIAGWWRLLRRPAPD